MVINKSCNYCPAQICFEENAESAVCPVCGQVNVLTRFESKIDLLKQSEEEKARVELELQKTASEKARLDQELGDALANLGAISEGQRFENRQLAELADAARKADGKQDVLHDLLTALGSASDDHTEQLKKLGDLSGRILESQDDMTKRLGLMSDIMDEVRQLKLDSDRQFELISEFTVWSTAIQKEDSERLRAVQTASRELLEQHAALDSSLSDLRSKSDEIQAELSSFHSEYTGDKRKKLTALYRTAENMQASGKFAEAEAKYREVAENGGAETEVYWRILLCRYGVEYVKDEGRNAYVPTMYSPDLTAPGEMPEQRDLLASLEETSAALRPVYESKLAELNALIAAYREVRFDEAYDVFISVKQNDDGVPTADSIRGTDLYYKLTGWGLKVFNSRVTQLRPGEAFEPQIISALMSAKVMIVIGTKKEYMEAKWVQNEWRRFQWLKKNDRENKRLLFCYLADGMKAKDIPAALDPSIQAIEEGFDSESRLREAMKAAFPDNRTLNPAEKAEPVSSETKDSFEKKLAAMLFRREFGAVIAAIDNVSTFELLSAKTVLFRVCAGREIASVNQLLHTVPELRRNGYVREISEYLDEAEAEKLEALLAQNIESDPTERPDVETGRRGADPERKPPEGEKTRTRPKEPFKPAEPARVPYAAGTKLKMGRYKDMPIEWQVVETDGKTATLLSVQAVELKEFDKSVFNNAKWESSTLRKWLNGGFLHTAFAAQELARLETSTVKAAANPEYSIRWGKDTRDTVWIPDIEEVKKWFRTDASRICHHAPAADPQSSFAGSNGPRGWWLRSPGHYSTMAAVVLADGSVNYDGMNVLDKNVGIRPVVRIRL